MISFYTSINNPHHLSEGLTKKEQVGRKGVVWVNSMGEGYGSWKHP